VTHEADFTAAETEAIALKVREELARRRISRQRLADDARISLSTLEKALSGARPFTLATLIRLEDVLKTSLRPAAQAPSAPGLAPESLGAYSRKAVTRLEGGYVTLRPSFEGQGAIYAYRTEIVWDEASSSLTFSESNRTDGAFTQSGQVALPNQSGHVYLVTNTEGQFRLIILSRPAVTGEMYGLLSTLHSGLGAHLNPAAAIIAFVPDRRLPGAEYGRITAGHPCFAAYRACLDRMSAEGYVQFYTG
jgi:transcriptional regulator with XRE-family HTH domain